MKLTKTTAAIRWFVLNGLFFAAVAAGALFGYEGAANAALFFSWTMFIFSLFLLNDEAKDVFRNEPRSVPAWIDGAFDLTIIVLFAYAGWFWTGGAYMTHALIVHSARNEK